ncbi:type II toxin-antitoxin system death-on-curing family toxin [Candidatus Saccharibacteria bacterium]|nr:MAG: type II toxin-antitoxin system death-on-curing family toxin [Candidatus Saccharibacteria bacterium]
MNVKTFGIDQLLMLHSFVLANTGGGDGVRDIGRLEAALATQTQEVFGTELYPELYNKAGAIIRGIIADHPFIDGNKRTAMLAGLTLMKVNGLTLRASNQELEDFAVQVAVEHLGVEEISEWLKKHVEVNV